MLPSSTFTPLPQNKDLDNSKTEKQPTFHNSSKIGEFYFAVALILCWIDVTRLVSTLVDALCTLFLAQGAKPIV